MTIRGKVISFQVFRFDATAPSTLIGEHDAAMVPPADRACGADRQSERKHPRQSLTVPLALILLRFARSPACTVPQNPGLF
jgi:hypothetical protein